MLLIGLSIKYRTQYRVGTKYFDFYLPETNTLIEVDGNYWHGDPKIYKGKYSVMQKNNHFNDLYKTSLAEASGYKLFRF